MPSPESESPLDPRIEAVLPDLDVAYTHHQEGRLDAAEPIYEAILRAVPELADARYLLGMVALARGQAGRAIGLIEAAIPALPAQFAEAHFSLGNAYLAHGDLAAAESGYRRAIAMDPAMAVAHANLSRVLNQQERFEAAAAAASASATLDPTLLEAHLNHAVALRGRRRFADAEQALRRALGLRPDRAETLDDLGVVLRELGRLADAAALHERAIALDPRRAASHLGFGETMMLQQDAERGRRHLRTAAELDPGGAANWLALGMAERALGDFDRGQECFRRALAIDPNMMAARWNLTVAGRQDPAATDTARLRSVLAGADSGRSERIAAGFALGKIMDDADRFDEAFALFARANAEFRELRAATAEGFDRQAFSRFVDSRIAANPAGRTAQVAGSWSELPVFVVGLPRSGTTLVEQIAASHSLVFGAGELPAMGEISRALAASAQASEVRTLAEAHVARLGSLAPGKVRVIDKLPDNVLRLDQIAALFPAARIVHVRRDGRDTGLSNFFQFYTLGNQFACDLEDIGVRVRETERLARHFRSVLPVRMLTIDYESLVADLAGQSRRLIDFLGLDWEPGCLAFHRTERAVTTPSTWQVRQPIYTRSVGRWRHYQRHLGRLVASLGVSDGGS